jgi:hypothetical protein
MKVKLFIILYLFLVLNLASCGIYSFTGASYGTAKTVSIKYFENKATLVNPALSQTFTEGLKDKFLTQTPLKLIESKGDLQFEGNIVSYSTSPMGIQAGETAASNRLTIIIKVKFTNSTNPEQDFEKQYTDYEDYESTTNLAEVESALIDAIIEKIIDNIFNDSVVNW